MDNQISDDAQESMIGSPSESNREVTVANRRAFLLGAGGVSLVSFVAGGLTGCAKIRVLDAPGERPTAWDGDGDSSKPAKKHFSVEFVLDGDVVIAKNKPGTSSKVTKSYILDQVHETIDEFLQEDDEDYETRDPKIQWKAREAKISDHPNDKTLVCVACLFKGRFKIKQKEGDELNRCAVAERLGAYIGVLREWHDEDSYVNRKCEADPIDLMAADEAIEECEKGPPKDGDPIPTC